MSYKNMVKNFNQLYLRVTNGGDHVIAFLKGSFKIGG